MARNNPVAEVATDRQRSLLIGGAVLLMAACLTLVPQPAASADAGIQIAADESESDKDTGTSGSDQEESSEEDGDKKRKSYRGATEPSY